MRRIISVLIISLSLLINVKTVKSQDMELGVMVGVTEYMGELTKKDITFSQSKIGLGGLYRYYLNPRLNFKASLFFGIIEGSDADWANYEDYEIGSPEYENANWRHKRNLSFKSNIWDLSAQAEFNILPFVSGHRIRNWTPYVYAGVSLFHFNPKAEYEGTWYELQPLGTEGQNAPGGPEKYSLYQFSIPYGIGIKYSFRNLWVIGIEATQRKTFTDYMDDVSYQYFDKTMIYDYAPDGSKDIAVALSDRAEEVGRNSFIVTDTYHPGRGNSEEDDSYFWFGITISKTIRNRNCERF